MDDTVALFVRLFRGRGDAYGSWTGAAVRSPLTFEHFREHLLSANEADWFGVYNVIGDRCSWGCVDIDVPDYGLARNIRASLSHRDIPSWIEQTTRGFHVWVFPAEPLVSASMMRNALTVACTAIGYVPKEIFPKQTKVTGTGLGNYVRLPFNGFCAASTHVPRMFMEFTEGDTAYAVLGDFLEDVDRNRAPVASLERVAALIPNPQPVDVSVDYAAGTDLEPIVRSLPGLAYRIWRDGPLAGNDRSTTMVYLARVMADRGLSPQDTMEVLRSCDDRWGKRFLERGDAGEDIIKRILQRAYS